MAALVRTVSEEFERYVKVRKNIPEEAVSAIGEARGPAAGLAALEAADAPDNYQPYWAVRAHLLSGSGDLPAAREAYERAAGLTADQRVRAFLLDRRDRT